MKGLKSWRVISQTCSVSLQTLLSFWLDERRNGNSCSYSVFWRNRYPHRMITNSVDDNRENELASYNVHGRVYIMYTGNRDHTSWAKRAHETPKGIDTTTGISTLLDLLFLLTLNDHSKDVIYKNINLDICIVCYYSKDVHLTLNRTKRLSGGRVPQFLLHKTKHVRNGNQK